MNQHKQCEDCGKCREVLNEEFCLVCEYASCERGDDCADPTSIAALKGDGA